MFRTTIQYNTILLFNISLLQHIKKIFLRPVILKLLMYLIIKLNHIDGNGENIVFFLDTRLVKFHFNIQTSTDIHNTQRTHTAFTNTYCEKQKQRGIIKTQMLHLVSPVHAAMTAMVINRESNFRSNHKQGSKNHRSLS